MTEHIISMNVVHISYSVTRLQTYTNLCVLTRSLKDTTQTMLQNTGMLLTVCSTSKMVWIVESLNPMAL